MLEGVVIRNIILVQNYLFTQFLSVFKSYGRGKRTYPCFPGVLLQVELCWSLASKENVLDMCSKSECNYNLTLRYKIVNGLSPKKKKTYSCIQTVGYLLSCHL